MNPKINKKNLFLMTFGVLVTYALLGSLVHVLVFGGIWELGLAIGDLLWAFVFVFLFTKTCFRGTLKEAAGFGILIGLLLCSPIVLGFFPLQAITDINPDFSDWIIEGVIPSLKVLYWYILTILKIAVCGIVAGLVYKPLQRQPL